MKNKNHSLLLVANWSSGTEYAWWLMESFWLLLGEHYSDELRKVYLAYPDISTIPKAISGSALIVKKMSFKEKDVFSLLRQCKFIRKHRVGTIYFSDYPSCSMRYLFYRLSGVKHIIVHDHTPGIRDAPGKLKMMIKKIEHRIPLICASGLIAATEYVRRRHIEINRMPEHKCFCAPNGLPKCPDVHQVDLFKEYGIPENRKIMITTGRASKYKGIDFALCIVEQLVNKQQRKDIHYLFCGDGPDLELFKSMAKNLCIEDYVTFSGQIDTVFAYLKSCDFAIHPSKGEVGYSLSILEYMQAGLPVIVPDNPSVCGATIDATNGYIYKENDLSDAAAKVLILLDHPEICDTMGTAAKKLVLEKYKLSNTQNQLLQSVLAINST